MLNTCLDPIQNIKEEDIRIRSISSINYLDEMGQTQLKITSEIGKANQFYTLAFFELEFSCRKKIILEIRNYRSKYSTIVYVG